MEERVEGATAGSSGASARSPGGSVSEGEVEGGDILCNPHRGGLLVRRGQGRHPSPGPGLLMTSII